MDNIEMIQITAGRGPAECCWVVAQVLKILLAEASDKGLETMVLHRVEGQEPRTLLSVVVQIEGSGAKGFVNDWHGTVQWIGTSRFRQMHKRKNWFVAVNRLDLDKTGFNMAESEICYQAMRAGGPGGQHVNKVNTAVRATHVPTGISVVASDTRSQMQNRKMARERLLAVLKARHLEEQKSRLQSEWQNHDRLRRGSPVRVFEGDDYKRYDKESPCKYRRHSFKQSTREELNYEI